jgi:hypothetical protein
VFVPGGAEYDVIGDVVGKDTELDLAGSTDGPLSCRGLRMSLSYGGAWTKVSVPSNCLGTPHWVRVGDEFWWEQVGFDHYKWDNAFRNLGVPGAGTTRRLHAG